MVGTVSSTGSSAAVAAGHVSGLGEAEDQDSIGLTPEMWRAFYALPWKELATAQDLDAESFTRNLAVKRCPRFASEFRKTVLANETLDELLRADANGEKKVVQPAQRERQNNGGRGRRIGLPSYRLT